MASYRGGKGPRGGDYRKREAWSGTRDYNKSGRSSPGPGRSNSPWRTRPDYKEPRDNQHGIYVNHLRTEWKKVEQDLIKDQKLTGTVEFVAKTPADAKDDEDHCKVEIHLNSREEKAESPD